jgi:hypothetical protein
VDADGIALPSEGEERVELGTLDILPRGIVGEDPIDRDPFELPIRVLVEATDPDVTDPPVPSPLSGPRDRLYPKPTTLRPLSFQGNRSRVVWVAEC